MAGILRTSSFLSRNALQSIKSHAKVSHQFTSQFHHGLSSFSPLKWVKAFGLPSFFRNSPHIRKGAKPDADLLWELLRPSMEDENILAMTKEDFTKKISNFYVYVVDGKIAGSACIKRFESANTAELGKICTHPSFQGRGVATKLTEQLIGIARDEGLDSVFALTINPAMARVFTRMGFTEEPREHLCGQWRSHYDMTRPSKAFVYQLTPASVTEETFAEDYSIA